MMRTTRWVWLLAGAIAALHIATNHNYGFHRDELQFLYDSRRLAWGFVAYPPLTAAVEHVSELLFGVSLTGLRLASVVAQAAVVVLTAAMTRIAGGGRWAQLAAAAMTGFSLYELFEGTEFQYGTFDLLWTALTCYAVLQLVTTEDRRWWMLVGVAGGLGLMTKYTMLFVLLALVAGFVLSNARRLMASWWFAAAFAVVVLIALPNVIWQAQHHFVSLQFLQSIHARDVRNGRGDRYWPEQLYICTMLCAVPMVLAGLWRALREARWRAVGWLFGLPLLFFAATHARAYYAAALYPMMVAVGTPVVADWVSSRRPVMRMAAAGAWGLLFAAGGCLNIALMIPFKDGGRLFQFATKINSDFCEEIGWDRLVATVAQVQQHLTPEQRANYTIFASNYGEYGALDLWGPALGLPHPVSVTNTAWLAGPPQNQPQTVIVVGLSPRSADHLFTACRVAALVPYRTDISNEESRDDPNIYVCGPPHQGWAQFWRDEQWFG